MFLPPVFKPNCANFSAGPCAKPPNWHLSLLQHALIGRSHRSAPAVRKIQQALALTRDLLEVPTDYQIAFLPGSATGAMETALWNLAGYLPIDILLYDYFSYDWYNDIRNELKLKDVRAFELNKLAWAQLTSKLDFSRDFVFVSNATSIGMAINDISFIPTKSQGRKGLVICDASAQAFSKKLDFSRLDVVAFSAQKNLGAESGLGVLILSPDALKRLEQYNAPWPIAKIMRLKKQGEINDALFSGQVINTISLLLLEDYINSLLWIKNIGGVKGAQNIIAKNNKLIRDYVHNSRWLGYYIEDEFFRAKTSHYLRIIDKDILSLDLVKQKAFIDNILQKLADHNIAYDIESYRSAPLGLRLWGGATVQANDLALLCQWLDYIFYSEKAKLTF